MRTTHTGYDGDVLGASLFPFGRARALALARATWGQAKDRPRNLPAIAASRPIPTSAAIDARTTSDLDLDGLFTVLDRTESPLGQQWLYHRLHRTDISATQSVRFLDLLWASIFGWLFFNDVPAQTTIAGGVVILASSLWIAHRESRARAPAA